MSDPKLHRELMSLIAAGFKDLADLYFKTQKVKRPILMEIIKGLDEESLIDLMEAVPVSEYGLPEYLIDEMNRRGSNRKNEVN